MFELEYCDYYFLVGCYGMIKIRQSQNKEVFPYGSLMNEDKKIAGLRLHNRALRQTR